MTEDHINRLTRQTSFSYQQIKSYAERTADDEDIMIENIREAELFGINLDILGW